MAHTCRPRWEDLQPCFAASKLRSSLHLILHPAFLQCGRVRGMHEMAMLAGCNSDSAAVFSCWQGLPSCGLKGRATRATIEIALMTLTGPSAGHCLPSFHADRPGKTLMTKRTGCIQVPCAASFLPVTMRAFRCPSCPPSRANHMATSFLATSSSPAIVHKFSSVLVTFV